MCWTRLYIQTVHQLAQGMVSTRGPNENTSPNQTYPFITEICKVWLKLLFMHTNQKIPPYQQFVECSVACQISSCSPDGMVQA